MSFARATTSWSSSRYPAFAKRTFRSRSRATRSGSPAANPSSMATGPRFIVASAKPGASTERSPWDETAAKLSDAYDGGYDGKIASARGAGKEEIGLQGGENGSGPLLRPHYRYLRD